MDTPEAWAKAVLVAIAASGKTVSQHGLELSKHEGPWEGDSHKATKFLYKLESQPPKRWPQASMYALVNRVILGQDLPPRVDTIPVISFSSAGEPVQFTDQGLPAGEGMYRVDRPGYITDQNAFAVEVSGDSMSPKYENGQVVFVDTIKPLTRGCYAVVGLVTHERYVKRWVPKNGLITLESVNPTYPPVKVKREQVAFAYRVVGSKEL